MHTYALIFDGTVKCLFTARCDEDADNKAFGWARYHSFPYGRREDALVTCRPATVAELTDPACHVHDEWLRF